MAKKNSEEKTKTSVMEKIESGRSSVDQVMSFVDWLRYVFDWIKGLFGR